MQQSFNAPAVVEELDGAVGGHIAAQKHAAALLLQMQKV
jgi:hypothetical protein